MNDEGPLVIQQQRRYPLVYIKWESRPTTRMFCVQNLQEASDSRSLKPLSHHGTIYGIDGFKGAEGGGAIYRGRGTDYQIESLPTTCIPCVENLQDDQERLATLGIMGDQL